MLPAVSLSRKDFVSNQDVKWCPGCGDYVVLAQVQRVLPELGIPRENIVFVSGIGCSSRFPYYMNTYGMHSIHGRAPAIATGIQLSRPDLKVFVVTGDGDALSIGGNHILHAMRRNVNLTILMFNNRIYGLTKGQTSPTSEIGKVTKSTPLGSRDRPLEPLAVALGADATFVARVPDNDPQLLQTVIRRAAEHRGTAFVEIMQNCPVFNDGNFESITGKAVRADRQVIVRHGEPLLFGRFGEHGIRVGKSFSPEIVELTEGPDAGAASQCIVHDEAADSPALAYMLARLGPPTFPTAVGILRAVSRPTLSDIEGEQAALAAAGGVETSLADLWRSGDMWTVEGAANDEGDVIE